MLLRSASRRQMLGRSGGALFAMALTALIVVPSAGAKLDRPGITWDPIPFGAEREADMAAYSERHYGNSQWRLRASTTRAIVLHYTAGSSYSGAWATFAGNAPVRDEAPGVCTQFIVDKDGRIYQLTRLKVRCRHAIGINHRSIGIEMVQEDVGGPGPTAQAILDRRPQARAAVKLAAWLKQRYRIKMTNLIGHAMVNQSPLFRDLTGARNEHSDWQASKVREFRKRVRSRTG